MYRTKLIDLPTGIKGMTVKNGDDYTIVLNARHSHSQNIESYKHEVEHIERGDFDLSTPVGLIEIYAHREG